LRNRFIETLCELASQNDRIWLVTGDLGYSVLECFANQFPDRYVNAGVAEQNMIGVAAGLAFCGKIVFTYSIANFGFMRCLEQIRNDVCYHKLEVKVVAVGGGLAYGPLGYTHHAVEDLAVMRSLPNMAVITPADPIQAALATRAVVAWPGPCYLRLGKSGEPRVHQDQPAFQIGRPLKLRPGRDVMILASGSVVFNVLQAAEKLADEGIAAGVYSVHTIKPLEAEFVAELVRRSRLVVTVEEHTCVGGLGSAVAEVLSEMSSSPPCLKRIALPDRFCPSVGSQEFLRSETLSVPSLVACIRQAYAELREAYVVANRQAHAASARDTHG
jgi:transketolase